MLQRYKNSFAKVVLLLGISVLLPASVHAAKLPELEGIQTIGIKVHPFDKDAQRAHLDSAKIEKAIQDEFVKAGLTAEPQDSGDVTLDVSVQLIRNVGTRTASYRIVLRRWVAKVDDPKVRFIATVWERSGIQEATNWKMAERLEETVRKVARDLAADINAAPST